MFSGIQHRSILINSPMNSSQDWCEVRSTNAWSRELICSFWVRVIFFCECYNFFFLASTKWPSTNTSEQLQTTPASTEPRWGQCLTFCPALSTHSDMHWDHLHRARGRKRSTSEEIQGQEIPHAKLPEGCIKHRRLTQHCNTNLHPPLNS